MKKEYFSPEIEFVKIDINNIVLGDSIPEVTKENGEIIENW